MRSKVLKIFQDLMSCTLVDRYQAVEESATSFVLMMEAAGSSATLVSYLSK